MGLAKRKHCNDNAEVNADRFVNTIQIITQGIYMTTGFSELITCRAEHIFTVIRSL